MFGMRDGIQEGGSLEKTIFERENSEIFGNNYLSSPWLNFLNFRSILMGRWHSLRLLLRLLFS
jgi:hypothetical protein